MLTRPSERWKISKMFQIPVENLDNIRKVRKKVKSILMDIGLDSCKELLKDLKGFDPGEKYFYNTSWGDISLWEPSGKKVPLDYSTFISVKPARPRYDVTASPHRSPTPFGQTVLTLLGILALTTNSGSQEIPYCQSYSLWPELTSGLFTESGKWKTVMMELTICKFGYISMKKHVLVAHFHYLINSYFGLRTEEMGEQPRADDPRSTEKMPPSDRYYCKKCSANASSQDALMYHILTSDIHRDLENKLRSVISEHIKKTGLLKQMHIAPKPAARVAVPPNSSAPGIPATSPCFHLALPQNSQSQTVVQPVQGAAPPVTVASGASGSLTHSPPAVAQSHVTLVSSPLPVGQSNLTLPPSTPQPVFLSHGVPLNQAANPPALPLSQPVGPVNKSVGTGVLPIKQTIRPGVLPLSQPVGPISRPVGPGVLSLSQPVVSGVLPVGQPVRPGVLQLNPSMPIQLLQSGTAAQMASSMASLPSPPMVVNATQNMFVQPSSSVAEANQVLKQAKQWKTCPVCNELFPSNVYQVHMEVAHKHSESKSAETLEPEKLAACAPFLKWMREKTVRCLSCKCLVSEEELIRHLLVHGLGCLFCPCTFHDIKGLSEHSRAMHLGKRRLPVDYSDKGFQLDVDANGSLLFPHLDFITILPREELGEREVYLAVLAGIHSKSLVPVYIKVRPQTEGAPGRPGNQALTCPFCFGTFVTAEAYELHLKERHHIMPTVHTILKSPAFKCIHCCGVYTGNMTLAAIAIHLLRCRSAPKDSSSGLQVQPNFIENSELLLVNGEVIHDSSFSIKRKMPDGQFGAEEQREGEERPVTTSADTEPSPEKATSTVPSKRQRSESRMEAPLVHDDALQVLALNPKRYEDRSYEEKKQFLRDYFHKRPYPSKKEIELLSSLLWVWKIDVASFFGKRRKLQANEVGRAKCGPYSSRGQ
ncbi:hypothetical protein EI555_010552 [Monodon monoceros]|uniref:C2H2-type domain-containing protein n=1 Tax=Monodon monoceros TaxID=40151 RepID=A0A4U1FH95_MONMO|nr:hypothetical protein EI555_010552 [Monodon monoceros]